MGESLAAGSHLFLKVISRRLSLHVQTQSIKGEDLSQSQLHCNICIHVPCCSFGLRVMVTFFPSLTQFSVTI